MIVLNKSVFIPVLAFATLGIIYLLMKNNTFHYEREKKLLDENLLNQAKTIFESVVLLRSLNTQHEDLSVQIGHVSMTKQLSQLIDQNQNYFFKLIPLEPKNPQYTFDPFEKEALLYLQQHKEDKYYYEMPHGNLQQIPKEFHFIGSLSHSYDDTQGAIKISLPLKNYKETLQTMNIYKKDIEKMILVFSLLSFFGATYTLILLLKQQEKFRRINKILARKVRIRTKELKKLNKSLETRVNNAIKEVKEKEKHMLTQSRSAAMGEMLSMIAHQWRQPLSEINMANNNIVIELLLGDGNKKVIESNIESSFEAVEYLSQTIDDFSNFFKPTKEKEELIISQMMQQVIEMMYAMFERYKIELKTDLQDHTKIVTFKRELLHVIINILNNAKDAFLSIEKETLKREIFIQSYEEVDYIVIKICDNAGGIKVKNIEKIFEPYFSTKKKNSSGLGLYISYVIVVNHIQGMIRGYNSKAGACFKIKIPKSEGNIQ